MSGLIVQLARAEVGHVNEVAGEPALGLPIMQQALASTSSHTDE